MALYGRSTRTELCLYAMESRGRSQPRLPESSVGSAPTGRVDGFAMGLAAGSAMR